MQRNKQIQSIFIWQIVILAVFLSLTFANEFLDLPHIFMGDQVTTWRQRTGEISIELIIFTLVITMEIYLFRKLVRRIKTLEGFLPICAACKKIRSQENQWEQIESYLSRHTLIQFSHSVCPQCWKKLYPDFPRKES